MIIWLRYVNWERHAKYAERGGARSGIENRWCIYIYIYIQWGKKVFSQPPIVQVLPLKKIRAVCNFHHRYTSTMRDKIRKIKYWKSHCRIFKEFICKLWWKISISKPHILEWPFIVASLRHTCAIIMLSNQHLVMPHLLGGWIISANEKCSLTQIYTDLWTIFENFVYIEIVLDQLSSWKMGAKTKVLHL